MDGDTWERDWLPEVVQQAGESIVVTDPAGAIVYVNPAFERLTGYSKQEALGQNPRFLKSGRVEASLFAQLWATIRAGQVWKGHLINRRKDGTLFHEDATIFPLRNRQGDLGGYAAVKRDVTHEVELEEKLREVQGLETVGRLAGGIAHDFNNLLSVILNLSALGAQTLPDDHPLQGDLNEIHRAGKRAESLTRRLLAFSRRQVLQPVVVDLNELSRELVKTLQQMMGEQVEVETDLAADLWPVMVDPGQLEQVILSLAANSRDAMPKGGRFVVRTDNLPPAPGDDGNVVACVRLSVSDTGCGMDETVRTKLFQPFFTTKERGKGTGLGLPAVYGIVKQSGGSIEFESEPGKGTTFRISFPRVAGQSRPQVASRRQPKPQPSGAGTVLVTDDEEMLRQTINRILTRAGYKVLLAGAGQEALAIVRDHPGTIELLLTDLAMPGMGGGELAQQATALRPQMRVLFMSGYPDGELADRGIDISAHGYLQKPMGIETLSRKVREMLGQAEPAESAGSAEPHALDDVPAHDRARLLPEHLALLSPDDRLVLERACVTADYGGLLESIAKLQGPSPRLADALKARLEAFDYPGILDWLKGGAGPG